MSQSPLPLERERIPVYLLTGYLGSGKTTLLASWLQQNELANSALIINEVGEVGLDNHLLSGAVESSALVANTCICCTGLPGLEEALASLFWSRLHRKIKPFAAVIIETTGLAHPAPILDIFEHEPLLRERYRLAGVITTLSAPSGMQVLAQHGEAGAQVTAAQLVIITKTDLVPAAVAESLQASVRALNSHAALATSAQASLRAGTLLGLLASPATAKTRAPIPAAPETQDSAQHQHSERQADSHEGMHHHAKALFVPLPHPLHRQCFCLQLDRWIHRHAPWLLRVKGLVQLDDGSLVTAQWSLGDTRVDMVLHSTSRDLSRPVQLGLTVIAKEDFDPSAGLSLVRANPSCLPG
jgi:G3E family GTPase